MNFAQLEYPIFLAFIVMMIAGTKNHSCRKVVLIAASFYFYAYWDYRFLGLLVASTLWDFSIGLTLGRVQDPRARKSLVALSVIGNLGVLGFFKYYNFFIESAQAAFSHWGFHGGTLSLVLPIGISFYTFQTLSYSIDVYRRTIKPCRSLLDFSIYVMFFPQLVAGPIVRAAEFIPQLKESPRLCRSQIYPGLIQILRGFIKKILIADHLAMMVDPVFASPQIYSSITIAIAILAYAGQIYGDFAGYSDIAIGSARLLGFELPENFRHPYLATSIADFWRRWHITLSTWLRDYLYIPLGGNRVGTARTYCNLMITMVLGGLWHGAAWNFLAWGVWHGVALSLERALHRGRMADASGRAGSILSWLATFVVVLFGWMLFRSSSQNQFLSLLGGLVADSGGLVWLPPFPIAALLLMVIEHGLWASRLRSVMMLEPHRWYTPWLVGFGLAALAIFSPNQTKPFVYFQF